MSKAEERLDRFIQPLYEASQPDVAGAVSAAFDQVADRLGAFNTFDLFRSLGADFTISINKGGIDQNLSEQNNLLINSLVKLYEILVMFCDGTRAHVHSLMIQNTPPAEELAIEAGQNNTRYVRLFARKPCITVQFKVEGGAWSWVIIDVIDRSHYKIQFGSGWQTA